MDNSTHNMSEKLVQYLDGELSGTERVSMQQAIALDSTIHAEYNSLLATREAIRLAGLHNMVAAVRQAMTQERVPVRQLTSQRRIFRFSIVAAASVIIIAGSIMAYNYFSLTPGKVFSSHYQSYQLTTLRDNNSKEQSAIEKAYRNKDYQTAIAEFNKATPASTDKEVFLAGMSFMETGKYEEARQQYIKITQQDLIPERDYYLALDYIQLKDYDNALQLLNKIYSDPSHVYHEKVSAKFLRQVRILKKRN